MSKTVEIVIINRKGLGSHTESVAFTDFPTLANRVNELLDELPFYKVDVELTPSWEPTAEEQKQLRTIEEEG